MADVDPKTTINIHYVHQLHTVQLYWLGPKRHPSCAAPGICIRAFAVLFLSRLPQLRKLPGSQEGEILGSIKGHISRYDAKQTLRQTESRVDFPSLGSLLDASATFWSVVSF